MANPVKQAFSNAPKTANESVVKPVTDEVGRMLETGVQSIFGTSSTQTPKPQNPQENAQKKADDDRKKQNILRYFEALKMNSASYKQQQDFNKTQKQQEEIGEKQKVRQFDIQVKQKRDETVFRSQRRAEIKVKGG